MTIFSALPRKAGEDACDICFLEYSDERVKYGHGAGESIHALCLECLRKTILFDPRNPLCPICRAPIDNFHQFLPLKGRISRLWIQHRPRLLFLIMVGGLGVGIGLGIGKLFLGGSASTSELAPYEEVGGGAGGVTGFFIAPCVLRCLRACRERRQEEGEGLENAAAEQV